MLYSYLVFLVLGMLTTMLGPLLPLIAKASGIHPSAAGVMFSWQFGGSTLGTLLSATQVGRRSLYAMTTFGLLCCACGAAAFALLAWPTMGAAVALYGFGIGICIPALNLTMAGGANGSSGSQATVRRVTFLNACWTLGAISGPLLIKGIVNVRIFLFLIAGVCLALAVAGPTVPMPSRFNATVGNNGNHNRLLLASSFALLFFLYVGTENMVSGWISFYSVPVFHSEYRAMTSASIFWAAFLGGRLLSAACFREAKRYPVVLASVVAALLGVFLIFFFPGAVPLIVGTVLIGVGLAPIYPVLITDMARAVGASTPAATVCFAFSGMGASTLPYLSGRISEESGKITGGLSLTAITLTLLMIVYSLLRSRRAQKPA